MRDPAGFADVVGHANVVEGLRQIVREPDTITGILLHGPVGVGKRSLAQVFADALQCQSPTPIGDACGQCEACRRNAGDGRFNQFRITIDAENAAQRAWYISHQIRVSSWASRWVITVVDADRTPERVLDQFLSVIEGMHEGSSSDLTIVLLAQDPARMRPAVVSRCRRYALRPLSPDQASELLTRWLTISGKEPDQDCIDLVLTAGRNLPKALAKACPELMELSNPTPAAIRGELMPAWSGPVVAHCRALLQAWPHTHAITLDHENDGFDEVRPRLEEQRQGIRACLTAAYLHGMQHVPPRRGITEPALMFQPDMLADLREAFLNCAARNGVPVEDLWRSMASSILSDEVG